MVEQNELFWIEAFNGAFEMAKELSGGTVYSS